MKGTQIAALKIQFDLKGGVFAVGAKPIQPRILPIGTQVRVMGTSSGSALCTTRLRSNAVWGSIPVQDLDFGARQIAKRLEAR
jgi:hypothetical protein